MDTEQKKEFRRYYLKEQKQKKKDNEKYWKQYNRKKKINEMKGGNNEMVWKKKTPLPEESMSSREVEEIEDLEDPEMEEIEEIEQSVPKYKPQPPKYQQEKKPISPKNEKWSIIEIPVQLERKFKNNQTGETLDMFQAILKILSIIDE